jgi:hypothetical protein
MNKIRRNLIVVAALALSLYCSRPAAGAAQVPTISGAQAFETLKRLAGEWHSEAKETGGPDSVTILYRVTSGGSAVMETMFPGTGHEMVTMYHLDNGKLVMTHYCAAGNQPRMKLTADSTAADLYFKFAGGSNLNPKKDGHMHSAHLHLPDSDHFTGEWGGYKDGKPSDVVRFSMVRAQRTAKLESR